MDQLIETSMIVNGTKVTKMIAPRQHLIDFLRDELGLTGSHVGCEQGVCGACTVRVNGRIARGCLMLAVQLDGAVVETIEGVTDSGEAAGMQQAFHERNALQCGFCTPGMLMAALDLYQRRPDANRDEIREHMSGNYCRCTGYQAIIDAVEVALRTHRDKDAA
jgi:carbon-monoxide dehydrogenase small subunit